LNIDPREWPEDDPDEHVNNEQQDAVHVHAEPNPEPDHWEYEEPEIDLDEIPWIKV
jgi:hypothetical protein